MKEWLMCDFHIHTNYSDGKMNMKDVIDLYGKLNFDVICITDHILDYISSKMPKSIVPSNWISDATNFNEYYTCIKDEGERALQEYNMLVIPGLEFTNCFKNIHIVGIGIEKYICPAKKMIDSLKEAKNQGALLVAAHPFKNGMGKLGKGIWKHKDIRNLVDVFEAGNGIDFFPHVIDKGYRFIGNTDFHGTSVRHGIKGWKTMVKSKKDFNSIKKSILEGNVSLCFLD